jgi:hypothetical protein
MFYSDPGKLQVLVLVVCGFTSASTLSNRACSPVNSQK